LHVPGARTFPGVFWREFQALARNISKMVPRTELRWKKCSTSFSSRMNRNPCR